MEGNISVKDIVFEKKVDRYSSSDTMKDFTATQELTVTITLHEYRDLVSKCATAQKSIDDANKDKYSREQQIKSLTEQVGKLKAENYELKKTVDDLLKKEGADG